MTKVLGDFKVHPSAERVIKRRVTKEERQQRLLDVWKYIEKTPRATIEDVEIALDLGHAMAYHYIHKLEKAERIYKTSNMPAKYRVHQPVTIIKPAQLQPTKDDSSVSIPKTKPIDKPALPRRLFIDEFNEAFLRYLDTELDHYALQTVNKFRQWVTTHETK